MNGRIAFVALLAPLAVTAKVLPETLFIVQTQLYPWREQARGYLMRYPNQPLFVEPDLPYDKGEEGIDHWIAGWGSFPSQADYDRTVSLVKDYGMDGLQIFWGRPAKSFLAAKECPVKDYVVLPISTGFRELDAKIRAGIENALANDRKCIVGGKMLLGAYWTDKHCTPAEFKGVCDQIRAEYGDKFLFMAEVDGVDSYRREFWRTGVLSEKSVRKMEAHIREWARVADAVKCGQSSPVVSRGEKSERVCSTEFTRRKFEIMSRVLDEPEFKGKKLKVLGAIQGHMNSYMRGHNVVEDGTRTIRRCFDNALAFDPDVVVFAEWDEFNENTHLMPTLYSSWTLKRIMRYYTAKGKGRALKPVAGDDLTKPNLIVSFRKCLSPGERLTIEVLNVPDGARTGKVETRIDILDDRGNVVKALEPRVLDETELTESRYELDSAELAPLSRALQVRLSYRDAALPDAPLAIVEGFHPVNLAPANTWDHVCARQPIRDLPALNVSQAEVASGTASLAVSCDEPIRYAMLCGNGCIQYVQGKVGEPENLFRDGGDWAVFQVSPICVGRHRLKDGEKPYAYEVSGVEEAEWLYVREYAKGPRFELRDINAHATPPIYLRIPKRKLVGAKLKAEYVEKGGLDFRCEIPLEEAWHNGAYTVGKSMKTMTVTATRFPLQCRYPKVAGSRDVSFSVPVDADRNSMFYHFQGVTMSGKTWRSRPFVFEKDLGMGRMRCWSAMREKAVAIELPLSRIPQVSYDLSPRGGNVLLASTDERHWNGMLGTPFSPATLWNRGARTEGGATKEEMKAFWNKCAETVPERVREKDGTWSIEFDGDDYACIPWEMWPTFGGCTVELDVMPAAGGRGKSQSIWANLFGLYDLGIAEDGRLRCGFWGFKSGDETKRHFGPVVPEGEWTSLKVVNDCEKIEVFMNGASVLSFPVSMPASNTLSPILGGWHRDGLGFFKGRIRNLRVSHAVSFNETAEWQAKIDAASASGGGRVVIPGGTHHVAELEMKSNVTLELSEGARLKAVNDYALYRWQKGVKAELQRTGVLVAYGATNIAVVGRGTIDGGGDLEPKTVNRPTRWRNVYFEDCRDVVLRDVRMENPSFWTCFLRRCDGVHVKGLKIRALSNYNNDGLDLCVSNALVEDCDIISEDDSIVMKNFDADWVSEKVEIRNCRVSSNASYIKFGTETHGVLREFSIHDCEIVARAASFWRRNVGKSSWPGLVDPKHGTGGLVFLTVDGGVLENVRVSDIVMRNGVCVPIVFRLGRRYGRENWARSAMRGILLERIEMASPALCGVGNFISGVPGLDIADITIRDSSFLMQALPSAADWKGACFQEREAANPGAGIFEGPMPSHFLYVRHARNVNLQNVSVKVVGSGETRPAVVSDVPGEVSLKGCAFAVAEREPAPPAVLDDEGIKGLLHPNPRRDVSLKPEWRNMFHTFRSSVDRSIQPLYWYDPGTTDAVPLVVALHSWGASCHWSSPGEMVLGYCRKKGWAMVYPNYRGPNVRPEACGSDLAVQDILDAVEWAKAVRKIDASRIYIIGGSGGGHMTLLMAGRHPEVFAGAAAFCPITDLKRWHADSLSRKNEYAEKMEKSCGGTPSEHPEEYSMRSPLTHLHRACAAGLPVYVATGIHDGHRGSVPVGHSIRAFNALADEKDRISEDDIAFIEANEAVPERLAFKGEDPFYAKHNRVHLRATSAAVRLTIFEGGHSGNYPAGLDFLSRQRRGKQADFTLPATAEAGSVESITR